jgi:hypothetical protein
MTDRTYSPAGKMLPLIDAAHTATMAAFNHAHGVNESIGQQDEAVREIVSQLAAAMTAISNAGRYANRSEDTAADAELDRRLAKARE